MINQRVGLDPMIEPMTRKWFELSTEALITFEKPAWVTKVELIFCSDWRHMDPIWSVSVAGHTFRGARTECDKGNSETKSVIDIYIEGPCDELTINLDDADNPPETVRIHDFMEVRRAQMEIATELTKQLSTKLGLTPSSVATKTADQWRRHQ